MRDRNTHKERQRGRHRERSHALFSFPFSSQSGSGALRSFSRQRPASRFHSSSILSWSSPPYTDSPLVSHSPFWHSHPPPDHFQENADSVRPEGIIGMKLPGQPRVTELADLKRKLKRVDSKKEKLKNALALTSYGALSPSLSLSLDSPSLSFSLACSVLLRIQQATRISLFALLAASPRRAGRSIKRH